jgi:hypothetical protein
MFVIPGSSTSIEPNQAHMVLLVSSIAGLPPILVFLATGSHGLIGIGIHDEGINRGTGPAIFQFMGLMGEVQLPNAGILRKGTKSILEATGFTIEVSVLPIGSTIILLGPEPKEHFNLAPIQTHFGIK